MKASYFGNRSTAALILQSGQPKRKRTGNRWEFTWLYACDINVANDSTGVIPAGFEPMPALPGFPEYADYLLSGVDIKQSDLPNQVWVDLKYTLDGVLSGGDRHEDGDIEKSTVNTWKEIPVEKAIEAGWVSEDDIDTGTRTISMAGLDYTYSYWDGAFPWTEASVLNYLCQVGTKPINITQMPGLSAVANYAFWLCKGQNIRYAGATTEISTTYGYDQNQWEGMAIR